MIKVTTEEFIKKSRGVHGDKFDYRLTEFVRHDEKVKIICRIHGVFEQRPSDHQRGSGCFKCGREQSAKAKFNSNKSLFAARASEVHNNRYTYLINTYKGSHKKLSIICPFHGVFLQRAVNHLNGMGCPSCQLSKGELTIKKYLEDNNIKYSTQKAFLDCKDQRPLPFDFYIPEQKILIEYDGTQHYFAYEYFGGQNYLEKVQMHDKIKTDYCIKNNMSLVRIKYNEDIIQKLKGSI